MPGLNTEMLRPREDYRNLPLALEEELNTSSLMGLMTDYNKWLPLKHDCIRHTGHAEIQWGPGKPGQVQGLGKSMNEAKEGIMLDSREMWVDTARDLEIPGIFTQTPFKIHLSKWVSTYQSI